MAIFFLSNAEVPRKMASNQKMQETKPALKLNSTSHKMVVIFSMRQTPLILFQIFALAMSEILHCQCRKYCIADYITANMSPHKYLIFSQMIWMLIMSGWSEINSYHRWDFLSVVCAFAKVLMQSCKMSQIWQISV